MAPLVKIDKGFVDFAVFLGQRNFPADIVVGDLQVANLAFEFLEMIGDILGRHEFMPEQ